MATSKKPAVSKPAKTSKTSKSPAKPAAKTKADEKTADTVNTAKEKSRMYPNFKMAEAALLAEKFSVNPNLTTSNEFVYNKVDGKKTTTATVKTKGEGVQVVFS